MGGNIPPMHTSASMTTILFMNSAHPRKNSSAPVRGWSLKSFLLAHGRSMNCRPPIATVCISASATSRQRSEPPKAQFFWKTSQMKNTNQSDVAMSPDVTTIQNCAFILHDSGRESYFRSWQTRADYDMRKRHGSGCGESCVGNTSLCWRLTSSCW